MNMTGMIKGNKWSNYNNVWQVKVKIKRERVKKIRLKIPRLNLREVVMIFFMKLENFSSMNSDTELLSRMTKKDFL